MFPIYIRLFTRIKYNWQRNYSVAREKIKSQLAGAVENHFPTPHQVPSASQWDECQKTLLWHEAWMKSSAMENTSCIVFLQTFVISKNMLSQKFSITTCDRFENEMKTSQEHSMGIAIGGISALQKQCAKMILKITLTFD